MERPAALVLASVIVGAIGAALLATAFRHPPDPAALASPNAEAVQQQDNSGPDPELVTERLRIRRGDTLEVLLNRAGVPRADRLEIVNAVRRAFDVRKFRAGTDLVLKRSPAAGTVEALEYPVDPDHQLTVMRASGSFTAAVEEIPGVIRTVAVCGILEGSLFESIAAAGERPELALAMAEIFAWDIDFYTDPRRGDDFCLLVEKKEYFNGQPPTYKRILAARYNNSGTLYEGFLFPDPDGKPQYYSRDGRSLQAAFLRSPLKFSARVSSHFSRRRFHPILKIYRPHLGVDYAAPKGTPVQAIASGRVIFAGWSGGAGRMVKIRHANGFETRYLHLSRIFVRRGQRVAQGQRIGLVGATGLATGPHLDFRILKNGKYLNFERLKPPRARRLTAQQMREFAPARDQYAALIHRRLAPGPILASAQGTQTPQAVD